MHKDEDQWADKEIKVENRIFRNKEGGVAGHIRGVFAATPRSQVAVMQQKGLPNTPHLGAAAKGTPKDVAEALRYIAERHTL
jgi:hypothetical protein